MTNRVGKIVDQKYRLLRLIGQGGMGSVYEAEHVVLHTKVALKLIKDDYASSPEAFQRFLREAQAAGAIGHPNITKVHDFGAEDDGPVYAVMELLRGKSLEALLRQRGRLAPEPAVAVILQVLSALHAAHKAGIIHRDLKPDNVFVSVDSRGREEVKLLDFGVAKFIHPENAGLGLTKTGTILGTPHYLAPEQARGNKDIDRRIDIWSTGVMLYEILSGHLPFDGENYNEVLSAVLLETPAPLTQVAPHVSEGLAEVVHKALSKKRDERYASVAEMMEALMPFAGEYDEEGDSIVTPVRPFGKSVTPLPNKPARCELPTEIVTKDTDVIEPQAPRGTMMEALASGSVESPTPRPGNKSLRWSLGGAATGVAVIAAVLLFINRPAAEAIAQGGGITSSFEEDLTVEKPALAEPPATAPSQADVKASIIAQEPQVSLIIEGLPPEARAYLDGDPVTTSHLLPRSDAPAQLRVEAEGYQTIEQTVVLNRDLVVYLPMRSADAPPRKVRPAPKKADRGMGSGPKTSTPAGESQRWADNPFH